MATKRKSAPKRDTTPPRTMPGDAASKHPIDTAVDTFFNNDTRVREAMTRNLKERGAAPLKMAARAKAAFDNFSPSKYSSEERARRNFVAAGESPAVAIRAVVDKGVTALRVSAKQRSMKIHLGGEFDKLIEPGAHGAASTVALEPLMRHVEAMIASGPLSVPSGPAITDCRAEEEAQRRLDEILGDDEDDDPEIAVTPGTPAADTEELEADALVSQQVQTQMKTATSPEEKLLFAVNSRASQQQTDQAIETFELRAGPADVTSYHDFNNLQIAFEHVWEEIFDGRLAKLGQDLYHEYVKLQEFVGRAPGDTSIDTIDDLKNLMAEIRELAKVTSEATPSQLQPAGDSGAAPSGGDTTDAVVDVVTTILDPAGALTDAIGDETVAAILNPAGAIINAIGDLIKGLPQLTWASFPGPLPGNGDRISVRIEKDVVPAGTVEILLLTGPNTRGWKGIKFTELDGNHRPINLFWIANDPNDGGVWDRNSFNRLPLYTGQVASAYLEFWHEGIASIHAACFVMDGLSEKLTDRTRVTFTWLKDR